MKIIGQPEEPDFRKDNIVSPKVLFVEFIDQDGEWALRIPDAYGEGKDYMAAVTENLTLQFQPVPLVFPLQAQKRFGVACFPMVFVEDKEEKDEQ